MSHVFRVLHRICKLVILAVLILHPHCAHPNEYIHAMSVQDKKPVLVQGIAMVRVMYGYLHRYKTGMQKVSVVRGSMLRISELQL